MISQYLKLYVILSEHYRIELTFRSVYWALFGMGEPTDVELDENYSKVKTTGPHRPIDISQTE